MRNVTQVTVGLPTVLNLCIYVMVGFIDFIVDPCFQVMGDMLEAIVRPLQESKEDNQSQAGAPGTNNNNHSSRSSSLSSRSSPRSTPTPITRKGKLSLSLHSLATCHRPEVL